MTDGHARTSWSIFVLISIREAIVIFVARQHVHVSRGRHPQKCVQTRFIRAYHLVFVEHEIAFTLRLLLWVHRLALRKYSEKHSQVGWILQNETQVVRWYFDVIGLIIFLFVLARASRKDFEASLNLTIK